MEHPMYMALIVALSVLVAACAPRYADFFPYYDNGTKKPSVTLLPVYDEVHSPLFDDFADQMTKAVRNRIKRPGKIYCPPQAQVDKELRDVSLKELAATRDLNLFTRFRGTDFVVMMDVADIHVAPYKRGAFKPLYISAINENDAKVLHVAIRLKIVNLKGKEPKVARMEQVVSNHMISPEQLERAQKGDKEVLEMIRSRLARDLSQKIEETVCVKK